uniref:Portal protein n=1 Tax=candidate division CPR3 bacterium TaxID=2268181 RepID=A0A7V3J9T3_UNCC3
MGISDDLKDFKIRTRPGSDEGGMDKKASIEKEAQTGYSTGGFGQASGIMFTRPVEYRPEFASPDRWSFPKSLQERNRIWRMFYMVDGIAGPVVDVYVEMAMGGYDIVGRGIEGSIKETLESMCQEVRLSHLVSAIMREFLVIGEAVPHLFFDESKGYWDSWTLHKPENIEVLDTQLVASDPVLFLEVSGEELRMLKKILKAIEVGGVEVRGKKFLTELVSSKKVMLEPLNVTFIPRLLHPYDVRGMSLFSRLWRIWMYEDAIMNATIQTAKRHAAPVKTVQMGDVASGYIPSEGQVDDLLRALAQAEMDPHAWIAVPPTTKFDAWGTVERVMGIRNEYDVIERMKLLALGVSRDFVTGSSTFAAAQAGLQVFLSRLLWFRNFIEEVFIYPKVFEIIVRVNDWRLPSSADVSHRIVTEKNRKYVSPMIVWDKPLRPRVDKDMLDVYRELVDTFKVKVSERTISDVAGLDWEDELRKSIEEEAIKKVLAEKKEERTLMEDIYPSPVRDLGEEPVIPPEAAPEEALEKTAPLPEEEMEKEVRMHASSRKNFLKDGRDVFLSGVYRMKKPLGDIDNIVDRLSKGSK